MVKGGGKEGMVIGWGKGGWEKRGGLCLRVRYMGVKVKETGELMSGDKETG